VETRCPVDGLLSFTSRSHLVHISFTSRSHLVDVSADPLHCALLCTVRSTPCAVPPCNGGCSAFRVGVFCLARFPACGGWQASRDQNSRDAHDLRVRPARCDRCRCAGGLRAVILMTLEVAARLERVRRGARPSLDQLQHMSVRCVGEVIVCVQYGVCHACNDPRAVRTRDAREADGYGSVSRCVHAATRYRRAVVTGALQDLCVTLITVTCVRRVGLCVDTLHGTHGGMHRPARRRCATHGEV